MQKLNFAINKKYGGREYSVLSGDFYIINAVSAPSAIVECGFLSNREDEKLLISEDYQKEFSYQLFSAIMHYLYVYA